MGAPSADVAKENNCALCRKGSADVAKKNCALCRKG